MNIPFSSPSLFVILYHTFFSIATPRFDWDIIAILNLIMTLQVDMNIDVYTTLQGPSEFVISGVLKTYNATTRLVGIQAPTLVTAGRFDTVALPVVLLTLSLSPASPSSLSFLFNFNSKHPPIFSLPMVWHVSFLFFVGRTSSRWDPHVPTHNLWTIGSHDHGGPACPVQHPHWDVPDTSHPLLPFIPLHSLGLPLYFLKPNCRLRKEGSLRMWWSHGINLGLPAM